MATKIFTVARNMDRNNDFGWGEMHHVLICGPCRVHLQLLAMCCYYEHYLFYGCHDFPFMDACCRCHRLLLQWCVALLLQ